MKHLDQQNRKKKQALNGTGLYFMIKFLRNSKHNCIKSAAFS